MKSSKLPFTLCLLLLPGLGAMAQERDFEKEFEAFSSQIKEEYQSFNDKINKEFGEFLKQAWEQFPQEEPRPLPERPEPKEPVKYDPPKEEAPKKGGIAKEVPSVEIRPAGIITYVPVVKEPPVIPVKTPDREFVSRVVVPFYGTDVEVAAGFAANLALPGIEEHQVAKAWNRLCEDNYMLLIQDCLDLRDKHQLNDWAYADLAKQIGLRLYGSDRPSEVAFLQMFILLQSGYKVKIAKIGDQLTLMFATTTMVYGAPYITIDGLNYYICEPLGERASKGVFTYRSEFANAKNSIDLHFARPLRLQTEMYERQWAAKDAPLRVEAEVNMNLIDFYMSYPQCDMDVYSTAPISPELADAILPSLRDGLKGKSKEEAVGMLLNFCQTAFDYQTDREQFGYEKPFFLDEIFFYPFCDCEDRSILFVYLVRELTGLPAVLLNYPKHMAAAVRFETEETSGDRVNVNGEKYIVCDPTYIGAPIGRCMPEFKGVGPKVIF